MDVSESELRALVRESIARHSRPEPPVVSSASFAAHTSQALLPLSRGGDDGACLIEPAVRCNRCGYCLSFGH